MKNYFLALILFSSILSCKTDFELNAPYKVIPVVYGLLDQSIDTQYVKINKSFLGDGNNVDYAAINDCTLFDSLIAVIEAFDISNNLMRQDTLKEIWVSGIDSGIFYEGQQKLYYFTTLNNPLNEEYEYHLKVNVPSRNLNFDATTSLVSGGSSAYDLFNYTWVAGITNSEGIGFVQDADLSTQDFTQPFVKWFETPNGERYELSLRFFYEEHMQDSTIVSKHVDWSLGTKKSIDANGSGEFEKLISGASFFEMIAGNLNGYSLESQVVKRTFPDKPIEFILTVANEELNTYMEVNEPLSGIVTERPVFTNINNGIGIFASKYQCSWLFEIQDGTILELCLGSKTAQYKFCFGPQGFEIGADNYNVGCPQ
jgi:hypothetical protein